MALLAFYGGLVLGVSAGMTIMALLVISRDKNKPIHKPAPIIGKSNPD